MAQTKTSLHSEHISLDDPLLMPAYMDHRETNLAALNPGSTGSQGFVKEHLGILATSVFRTSIAIEHYSQLIEEQQNRLNAIMSSIDDGIILMESDGHIILQNELGRTQLAILCQCKKDRHTPCIIHDGVAQVSGNSSTSSVTNQVINGNHYELTFTPINQQKNNNRVSIRIRTITTEQNSETKYAEDTLPLIREMAAAIAHEINNPLTPVIGLSSTSHSESVSPEGHQKELQTIHRAGQRIADVIHNLLDFDAIHQWGKMSHLSLPAFVDNIWCEVKDSFERKDIRLENGIDAGFPDIYSNQAKVRQILLYILQGIKDNRIDIETSTSITINAVKKGDATRLTVAYNNADLPVRDEKNLHPGTRAIDTFRDLRILLAELLTRSIGGQFSHNPKKQSHFAIDLPTPTRIKVDSNFIL